MDLIDYATALGAKVVQRPPAEGRWGEWCQRTREIRLHPELGALQRDYTLAHEIGHAYHQHTGCGPRDEWEADVWAATVLIRRRDWKRAVQIHETVGAVAMEIGVLPKLVKVYAQHLRHAEQ
ncbi:ImmA/IrrE family metallo-endopeptidase [Nesterenkonia sandarakina]|uniref:Uncharacterized protein DUF955 n=1 Tax=Nesterenkonia sandarakina TaxID=272918 RepID=A0A2T0YJH0_9MICC|nr:ImmA/IrrE family metallo-endopeptidase [Nesterenkonia sandarakina]PRZ15189.1 uncharacterized protein DUF955 [Nesterenkonia sandarakina]